VCSNELVRFIALLNGNLLVF